MNFTMTNAFKCKIISLWIPALSEISRNDIKSKLDALSSLTHFITRFIFIIILHIIDSEKMKEFEMQILILLGQCEISFVSNVLLISTFKPHFRDAVRTQSITGLFIMLHICEDKNISECGHITWYWYIL